MKTIMNDLPFFDGIRAINAHLSVVVIIYTHLCFNCRIHGRIVINICIDSTKLNRSTLSVCIQHICYNVKR